MSANQVRYEWDYEIVDLDSMDVLDHWHEDKLTGFGRPLEENERLVLVRNEGNEGEGLEDRLWAYVEDGKLPQYFSNANGNQTGYKVPLKYRSELTNYLKHENKG